MPHENSLYTLFKEREVIVAALGVRAPDLHLSDEAFYVVGFLHHG